jgi:predicted enzyme related to lactoylglutathione lyase
MADYRGRFLWYELLTTDPGAAKAFYPKITGWGLQDWTGMETPYSMWTIGPRPVGGIMRLPEQARKAGAPPHWLAYVGTPSVDDTLEAATKRGAEVLAGPMDIPTVGRMAVLRDPQQAVFAVYTPGSEPGPEQPYEPGDVSWHELATTDLDAAWDFYGSLFGWKKTESFDMGPGGAYQLYARPGGANLGGIYRKPAEMPAPPHWLLYVRVADVKEGAQRIKSSGGQVLNGPMEVPGGDWIVAGADPQGAAFALHHVKKG